ncbi:MAG: isoprenyl transferase [Deltaproteobacteria bacterium]|nr:isoprenyl transferase [Deltaproteobacteria bacterium]
MKISSNGNGPTVLSKVPRHVAVVMDGNGRWAKKRFLPRVEGHRAGVKSVRMIVEESRRLGIRYLTLFAFSTENWQRPRDEVSSLMKLFAQYLESELELMLKNDIRLRAVGDLSRLPKEVQHSLQKNFDRTKDMQGMDLVLAVSYGGRDELVHAARRIAEKARSGELDPDSISEATITEHLYAPDVPDPDVLIRTSDENRISNFLLWQLAYSEIVVTPVLWPDFSKEEYTRCLQEFSGRTRRFGLTDEQLAQGAAAAK